MTRAWIVLAFCLALLSGCANSPEALLSSWYSAGQGSPEAIAGRGRPPRLPSKKNTPAAPQAPAAAQPQKKRTPVEAAMTRWLDPKVAHERFDQGMAEARRKHANLYGQPTQKHHVHSIYLGGDKNGPTVSLDPAYHRLITTEFQQKHSYNQPPPSPERQIEIMKEVYSKYPLPGVHF
jgi:hypothetical protein